MTPLTIIILQHSTAPLTKITKSHLSTLFPRKFKNTYNDIQLAYTSNDTSNTVVTKLDVNISHSSIITSCIIRLHRMNAMLTILTDVRSVCLSVCLSHGGVVVRVSDLGSKGPGFDPWVVPKSECMFVNICHY